MRKHEHGEPVFPTLEQDERFENAKGFQGKVESSVHNLSSQLEGYEALKNAGWIKDSHKEEVKKSEERVRKSGKRFGKYLLFAAVPVIMLAFKSSRFSERASAMNEGDKDKLELVKEGTPPIVYTEDSTENEASKRTAATEPTTATYTTVKNAASTEPTHAGSIKEFADKALKTKGNLKDCSGFTETYAEFMGHSELKGLSANEQVAYMRGHWHIVDGETAQRLANQGHLVIAGLRESGHGHTMAVVEGEGGIARDGKFYPTVEGGGMSKGGRSHGDKTAAETYKSKNRAHVEYFTPDQVQ